MAKVFAWESWNSLYFWACLKSIAKWLQRSIFSKTLEGGLLIATQKIRRRVKVLKMSRYRLQGTLLLKLLQQFPLNLTHIAVQDASAYQHVRVLLSWIIDEKELEVSLSCPCLPHFRNMVQNSKWTVMLRQIDCSSIALLRYLIHAHSPDWTCFLVQIIRILQVKEVTFAL